MARCPHNNVQQFTEMCLDCGRNVYETDQEYMRHLLQLKDQQRRQDLSDNIERLERELGIRHPGNNNNPSSGYDDNYGGPAGGW